MYKIEKIKDFEEYYIDTNGIIYSTFIKGAQGKKDNKMRPLKWSLNKDGYRRVVLSSKGNKKYVTIHRLMAKQFLNNYDSNLVVNHIDGNKQNNNINNLEMTTIRGNTRHAWQLGLCHTNKNAVKITIKHDGVIQTFNSQQQFIKKYPIFHLDYLLELRMEQQRYSRMCLRKENKHINCYFNGCLIKTFENNIEVAKYFNKAPNTISYKLYNIKDEKYKKYIITFSNQSTIESIE